MSEQTAAEVIVELCGDARYIVVTPVEMSDRQARLSVLRAFDVFPTVSEVAVFVRPELAGDKVHVIDKIALEPATYDPFPTAA